MSKDIKDYLHLYIGCDVKRNDVDDSVWKLVGVSASEVETNRIVAIIGGPVFQEWYVEETLPILRPLSDMTEKEVEDLRFNMPGGVTVPNDRQALDITPHQVKYLLSLGFDLFNLIDEGLAIDKTTLTS